MTTYLVTRHPATRLWVQVMTRLGKLPFAIDQTLERLDPATLQAGDTVVGTLPVRIAGELSARNIPFWSLDIDIPTARVGEDLSATELTVYGARLTRYAVTREETQAVAAGTGTTNLAQEPSP